MARITGISRVRVEWGQQRRLWWSARHCWHRINWTDATLVGVSRGADAGVAEDDDPGAEAAVLLCLDALPP